MNNVLNYFHIGIPSNVLNKPDISFWRSFYLHGKQVEVTVAVHLKHRQNTEELQTDSKITTFLIGNA